jgi:hypothetical protein
MSHPAGSLRWTIPALAVGLASFVAGRAAAEERGSTAHFGVGAFWVIPTFQSHPGWREALREDLGLSAEFLYDTRHWFVAASLAGSWLTGKPAAALLMVRGGLTVEWGSVAPYIAAGVGYFNESGLTTSLDNCPKCDPLEGSGAALAAEAGVLLFRHSSLGRVAVAAQYILPLFDVNDPFRPGFVGDRLPLVWLGVRLYH